MPWHCSVLAGAAGRSICRAHRYCGGGLTSVAFAPGLSLLFIYRKQKLTAGAQLAASWLTHSYFTACNRMQKISN